MKLELKPHNIVLLIGPENSFKSEWVSAIHQKALNDYPELNVNNINARDYPENSELSIEHKLLELVSFPNRNNLIIINAKSYSEDFRNKIKEIGSKNNYQVSAIVFQLKNEDYVKYLKEDLQEVAIKTNYFRRKVLPELKQKDYYPFFIVKEKTDKYFSKLELVIKDYELFKNCNIKTEKELVFIGDIHEDVDALNNLIKIIPNNTQIVLVGDYLDKGNNTEKIIPIIEKLVEDGALVVIANHESYVARRLLNKINANENEDELFSSLRFLANNKEFKDRFLKLYNNSLPYIYIESETNKIYVTHAPCRTKVLGKLDETSKRDQRNFYFKGRTLEEMSEELYFMKKQANESEPLHIFGHVANNLENIFDKNKVWLDTGSVYGNKLSALYIDKNGNKELIQVNGNKLSDTNLFSFVTFEKKQKNKI